METDLVCGREVDPENSFASGVYADRIYHFCSENCRTQFVQDPLKYVDRSKSAASYEQSTPKK